MSDDQTKDTAEPAASCGGYAVGDALAFRNYSRVGCCQWSVHRITKITKSGRMVCGPYTLNQDLTIRGDTGYSGPIKAQAVTPEIIEEVRRYKAISFLKGFDWKSLPTDSLEAAVAVTQQA